MIGAAETNRGARLWLNGVEVEVYRTGAFLAMVKTAPGTNTITLVQGADTLVRSFVVSAESTPEANAASSRQRNPYADLGIPSNVVYAARPPLGSRPGDVHVMVDAGHGGADSGALSPHGLKEKDFNLAQAKSIAAALKKAGFKVTMTRTGDTFPALYDRPRLAVRKKADVFISVHHNATGAGGNPREARHTVTYAWNDAGLALAAAVQKHVAEAVRPVRNDGAKWRSFAVCRNPAVPSCLIEVDFINLPEGEEAASDPVRREGVSRAVVLGLLDWLSG